MKLHFSIKVLVTALVLCVLSTAWGIWRVKTIYAGDTAWCYGLLCLLVGCFGTGVLSVHLAYLKVGYVVRPGKPLSWPVR